MRSRRNFTLPGAITQALIVAFSLATAAKAAMSDSATNDLPADFRKVSFVRWCVPDKLNLLGQNICAADLRGDNLVVVSHSNFVACLDVPTGLEKWRIEHDGRNPCVPSVGERVAVIRWLDWDDASAITTTGLDLNDGKELWSEPSGESESAPVLFRDQMYIGGKDRLQCFAAETHRKKWERKFAGVRLSSDGVIDEDLVVGLDSNVVARIDWKTGAIEWKTAFENKPTGIWVTGDRVYVHVYQDARLYCLEGKDGTILWKAKSPVVTVRPIVAGPYVALLGQGCGTSHFYGLIVVDRKTGAQVWSTGGDWNVESAALSGDFLYYQRGNSLNIFDLRHGVKCGYFVLDDIFNLLQGPASSLLIVSKKHGITKFIPNITELRTSKDIAFFKLDQLGPQGLFYLALFVLALAATVILGTGGKRTIPGTPETAGQIGTLWVLYAAFAALELYAGSVIWLLGIAHGLTSVSAIALISMVLPLLLLILAYALLSPVYLCFLFKRCSLGVPEPLNNMIADLAADIHLTKPVVPVCGWSRRSPAVTESIGKYFVIIPTDFEDTATRAAHGNREQADALIRLVIAHELAHAKTGDTKQLPLLRASRWLWIASTTGLIALVCARFFSDHDLAFLLRPVVLLGILVSGVSLLLSRLVSEAKERYADGLASTLVAPEMLRELVTAGRTASETSVLQNYLVLLQLGRTNLLKFAGMAYSLKDFSASASARGADIQRKREVVKVGQILSPFLALLAGLTSAIILELADVQKILTFARFLITEYGAVSDYWLKGMSIWNYFGTSAVDAVAILLASIVSAAIIVLPLRDSHRESDVIDLRVITKTAALVVVSLVVASIVSLVLNSFVEHGILQFKNLGLRDTPPLLASVALCVGMWIVILARWDKNFQDKLWWAMQLSVGLVLTLLSWAIIITYFDAIPVSSRVLLAISSSMISAILMNIGFETAIGSEKAYTAEGFAYFRILSLRFIRSLLDDAGVKRTAMVCYCPGILLQYTVPILLIALLIYPRLIGLDSWYVTHAGHVIEKLHRVTSIPPAEVKHRALEIWAEGGFGFAMSMFGGPGKLAASGVVMLLTAIVSLALGALMTVLRLGRQEGSKKEDIITKVPLLVELSRLLDYYLLGPDRMKNYRKIVTKRFTNRSPFVSGVEGLPLMAATCHAVMIDDVFDPAQRQAAINWILACRHPHGGFGLRPGQNADPYHTLAAAITLRKVGAMSDSDVDTHLQSLHREIQATLKQGVAQRQAEGLVRLHFSLEAMSILQQGTIHMDDTEKTAVQELCVALLENSTKSKESTFHAVEIFRNLGHSCDNLPRNIADAIGRFEAQLRRMDTNYDLERILQVIKMTQFAHPVDYKEREAVRIARDNLLKTYKDNGGLEFTFLGKDISGFDTDDLEKELIFLIDAFRNPSLHRQEIESRMKSLNAQSSWHPSAFASLSSSLEATATKPFLALLSRAASFLKHALSTLQRKVDASNDPIFILETELLKIRVLGRLFRTVTWPARTSKSKTLMLALFLLVTQLWVLIPLLLLLSLVFAILAWTFFVLLPMLWRKYVLSKLLFLRFASVSHRSSTSWPQFVLRLLRYVAVSFFGLLAVFTASICIGLKGNTLIVTTCIAIIVVIFNTRNFGVTEQHKKLYSWAVSLVLVAFLTSIVSFFVHDVTARNRHFARIIAEVRPCVTVARSVRSQNLPTIRGKVIVWDNARNEEFFTSSQLWISRLPFSLRASPADTNLTVFVLFGDATNVPVRASQPAVAVATIYWPSLDTAGCTTLTNLSMWQLREQESHRDYVAEWIRSLRPSSSWP